MPAKRLYIVGNGFDLHHKIRSSYGEFGAYVRNSNPSLYDTFEKYFSFEGNWSSLEETLAHLDVDLIIDEASDFLVSYGAEDWSDAYHHDYQFEVSRIVELLSTELKSEFTNWIIGLEIPDKDSCGVPLLPLDKNAQYLNFNYTNTLQRLYGMPGHQVMHIHNSASDPVPDLILGHAYSQAEIPSLNHGANLEDQDVRVTEVNEILDEYFSKTYKPTSDVLQRHMGFFSGLAGVSEIYVVGHSLSEVDSPYICEIVEATKFAHPTWVVTYYNSASIPALKEALLGAGVMGGAIAFVQISQLPA
jgi:Bacteriophage abortive infection AbiH